MEGKLLILMCVLIKDSCGKIWLRPNGNSNGTYSLINSVLGPKAMEVPDCAHSDDTRHITQVLDKTLNRPVFDFHIHTTLDNDRCQIFDRQRVEIKTYDRSVRYLKCYYGETVTYSWNFRLDSEFKASSKFCHIHQIKEHGLPVITLSTLKNSDETQILEVIHNNTERLKSEDLSLFLGTWIHAKEELTCHTDGKYSLALTRLDNGEELMSVTSHGINLWRDGIKYLRPKWGIYRSVDGVSALRDEHIYFDSFCLSKCSNKTSKCV